jgi:hypothetical protein
MICGERSKLRCRATLDTCDFLKIPVYRDIIQHGSLIKLSSFSHAGGGNISNTFKSLDTDFISVFSTSLRPHMPSTGILGVRHLVSLLIYTCFSDKVIYEQ